MPESTTRQHRRPLGTTGLEVHPLGFGCYRVIEGNQAHEAALRTYLESGGNLIDTSANYGDGLSELLVGQVLKGHPELEAVVVTKGGYIQGQNMGLALKHQFPEVVEYSEELWHSIHPEFLETQLQRSLQRLQRNRVDVYLLHNPEYFLEDQAHKGQATQEHQEEFYRRVQNAFAFLEEKVAAGEIGWYGISSNNFPHPASSPTATSIARCYEAAESLTPQHHFRVVQLPLNPYEPGAALETSHGGKTALEYCREKGIGVLANRGLNAFTRNRMVRLADFRKPDEPAPGPERLEALLKPLREMERELASQFEIPLLYGTNGGIADYYASMIPQIHSAAHWEQIYFPYVIQPVEKWATECQQLYGQEQDWQSWWLRFTAMIPAVLEDAARYVAGSQQQVSDDVRSQLYLAGYEEDGATLSQMAINTLLHLPGLTSVLTGMRRNEYVADALGVLELGPVDSLAILSRFGRMQAQPASQTTQ